VIPRRSGSCSPLHTEDGPQNLYTWLAARLPPVSEFPPARSRPIRRSTMSWFVFLPARPARGCYTRLRTIMRETSFAPPTALRQLPRSLTRPLCHDHVRQPARGCRQRGAFCRIAQHRAVVYAPNKVADLPAERALLAVRWSIICSAPLSIAHVCPIRRGYAGVHERPPNRRPTALEKLFGELERSHLFYWRGFPDCSCVFSCVWPSAIGSPIRAMLGKCWPTPASGRTRPCLFSSGR